MARTNRHRAAATTGIVALVASGVAFAGPPGAAAADWTRCLDSSSRQATFARASAVSGVPEPVLLGVSFMQSRWDDHGSSPSTSGGYGPMHLSDLEAAPEADRVDPKAADKGEGTAAEAPGPRIGTLDLAADLTQVGTDRLRTDEVANICGGAAVLAAYQRELSPDRTQAARPWAWTEAVAKYSGATEETAATRFAEQVFAVIREGRSRTTNDGHRVVLAPVPSARVDHAAIESMALASSDLGRTDCPPELGCEAIPAPYEWYDKSSPYRYGNHDLANRQEELDINYIVVHNTEASWETTLQLVQNPRYVSWQYSLRSSDGHIAQHVDNRNVAWHAGNWYVNMHSIGLEHEGFAAQGSEWYTESMYQTSATLVRYLAAKYDVPLDRAHIIGHDQIPGVTAAHVRGMHWDPGPYWDWEHYMELLGAPIAADRAQDTGIVTVAPGFEGNRQPVTGCDGGCVTANTNFVYLRTAPSENAPLVKDAGLHPDGSHSTTHVSDIGARAAAGHKFAVAAKGPEGWVGVWYLGHIAWLQVENALGEPAVQSSGGRVVVPAGDDEVPVYGRAYPEEAAYPDEIPYQPIAPLQYSIKPGQGYVLADDDLGSDYYYAKTYDDSLAGDHTVVAGEDEYYQIWFGHRLAYVRAADVEIRPRPGVGG